MDEEKKLVLVVSRTLAPERITHGYWKWISSHFENKSNAMCRRKWRDVVESHDADDTDKVATVATNLDPWTDEDDSSLMLKMSEQVASGKQQLKWTEIARKLHKTPRQCQYRWKSVLRNRFDVEYAQKRLHLQPLPSAHGTNEQTTKCGFLEQDFHFLRCVKRAVLGFDSTVTDLKVDQTRCPTRFNLLKYVPLLNSILDEPMSSKTSAMERFRKLNPRRHARSLPHFQRRQVEEALMACKNWDDLEKLPSLFADWDAEMFRAIRLHLARIYWAGRWPKLEN